MSRKNNKKKPNTKGKNNKRRNNNKNKKSLPNWALYSIVVGVFLLIVIAYVLIVGHRESNIHGFDTSKEVINTFLKSFGDADTVRMQQCVIDDDSDFVKKNMDTAIELHDDIELDLDNVYIGETPIEDDDLEKLKTETNKDISEAIISHVELPMTQIINDKAYAVVQIYNIMTVKIEDKWFIVNIETLENKVINSEDDFDTEGNPIDHRINTDTDYHDAITVSLDDKYSTFIGNKDVGFIKVGKDWKPYEEEGYKFENAVSQIDYISADKSSIITLASLDVGDLTPEEYGSNIYYQIEQDSDATDLTAAEEMVGPYKTKQIFCHYTSDDIYFTMCFWKAPEQDDKLHCLMMQFKPEHRNDYKYITTFTFEQQ